jgi:acetolactate synthase-1/2/3 large subunit
VELLNANGVDCIFLNPGTDTFPVQEAITRFVSEERPAPRVVLCPDESVAMAAAHGYFLMKGRAQVVLVHVDAGTLQVGGALHNAQRGRIGVVFCAGHAPLTLEGEMRGSRNVWIHWIQEQIDQGMIVRGLTKWDYELRRNESIHSVVNRAFHVANSEPPGPVYLSLPREVLMENVSGVRVPSPDDMRLHTTPQADAEEIGRAAGVLAKSSRPLVIVGDVGRNPAAVDALVGLAELISAPVVASADRMSFPTTNPLWVGRAPGRYLQEADVILMVDVDIPYVPVQGKPGPDAKIIWIDRDPVKESIPLFTFPASMRLQADSAKALPVLKQAVEGHMSGKDRQRFSARREAVAAAYREKRTKLLEAARQASSQGVSTPAWLVHCLDQVLGQDVVVLEEAVTNASVVADYLTRTQPGTQLSLGGSSLGWALGGSIGVKLASPDRTVAALVGDGAFLFGCPTAALWTAQSAGAPFLTVIFNNQMYYAAKMSWKMGYPGGYGEKVGEYVGTQLSPSPDYALLAKACHAYGERVENPLDLIPAIEKAVQVVRGGQPAVLDVRIQRP